MQLTFRVPQGPYAIAWSGLGLILAYFLLASIAVRWRPRRSVRVARYVPPDISPALAAYLYERGRCERAFAAALVSLAAKGFLRVRQHQDWFVLDKLKQGESSLPVEESAILTCVFPASTESYNFNSLDYTRISSAYDAVRCYVADLATPDLVSSHTFTWLFGVFMSVVVVGLVLWAFPGFVHDVTPGVALVIVLGIGTGVSAWIAAIRVWPATLRKLLALIPGSNQPRRPFLVNDAIPIYLTGAAIVGFGLFSVLTSSRFAAFFFLLVTVCGVFRHVLKSPTRKARLLLDQLLDFREFLSRADADRMNRANQAGRMPDSLAPYSGYAIALDVEHAWGEEITSLLTDIFHASEASEFHVAELPFEDDGKTIELKIDGRK